MCQREAGAEWRPHCAAPQQRLGMGLILLDVDATAALPSSVSLESVGDSMIIAGLNPPCLLPLSVHAS